MSCGLPGGLGWIDGTACESASLNGVDLVLLTVGSGMLLQGDFTRGCEPKGDCFRLTGSFSWAFIGGEDGLCWVVSTFGWPLGFL